MKLTHGDIAALAGEVDAACRGGAVQKVWDGRPGELLLKLRCPGATRLILLSSGDEYARIHLMDERGERRPEPTPFVSLCRKHLTGSRLATATSVVGDRIALLLFELGESAQRQLVCELTGRHGNVFLLDGDERVLGSYRPSVSHKRSLAVGDSYAFPPPPPAGWASEPASAITCVALARAGEGERAGRELSDARASVGKAIRAALKRRRRLIVKLERDAAKTDRAEALQRNGELLQSAYGQVKRGAPSVTVPDYRDPEMRPVTVALDQTRSLEDNTAP